MEIFYSIVADKHLNRRG